MILLDGSRRELVVEAAKKCLIVLEDVSLDFHEGDMRLSIQTINHLIHHVGILLVPS